MELARRKRIRLQGYDYSQNGVYFITICAKDRECLFGRIFGGRLQLYHAGMVARENIQKIKAIYPEVKVLKYVIMPNHIHMIVELCRERIACVPADTTTNMQKTINDHPTKNRLSKLIQSFKASVTKQLRQPPYGDDDLSNNSNQDHEEKHGTHAMRALRRCGRNDFMIILFAQIRSIKRYGPILRKIH